MQGLSSFSGLTSLGRRIGHGTQRGVRVAHNVDAAVPDRTVGAHEREAGNRPGCVMRRRAASGKRWSAVSTIKRWDDGGAELAPSGSGTAAKARVFYRLDGKSRKKTFAGPGCEDRAEEYRALLAAAYAGDWPADAEHRPAPPVALPAPAHTTETAPPPSLPAVPAIGDDGVPKDVAGLAQWKLNRYRTTPKRRTGGKRSPKTIAGYRSELRLGGPRLCAAPLARIGDVPRVRRGLG